MTRSPVLLRCAVPEDAPFLAELWSDAMRRCDAEDLVADAATIIDRAAATDGERLVVAELDGRPAGAVLLRLDTLTPVNLEPVVQTVSPHVLPAYRRHGVGRALMEAAVGLAEELGVAHVVTGSAHSSREAHRFMARLALSPMATLRVAPTAVVRAKLVAQRPALRGAHGRQLGQVLAARRAVRRQTTEAG